VRRGDQDQELADGNIPPLSGSRQSLSEWIVCD
jgi:hypothetical protein